MILLLLGVLGALVLLGGCEIDEPVTGWEVNATEDEPDAAPGDGVCETTPGSGTCTLRAAVMEANAGPVDQINVHGGTFVLTRHGADEDAAVTGDLDIIGPVTIDGEFLTLVDGDAADRIFDVQPGATLTTKDLDMTNGSAPSGGAVRATGGTANLFIGEASANHATAGDGGAVAVDGGTVNAHVFTLRDNHAVGDGGAMALSGGAAGTLTLASVVSGTATGAGGGVAVTGAGTSLAVSGTTIAGNDAPAGAALSSSSAGSATLVDATVAASTGAGAAIDAGTGAVTVTGSIVANSATADCAGAVVSGGSNIELGTSCGFAAPGDLANTDPLLGPLANGIGAYLPGMAPGAGSPAIDANPGCTTALDTNAHLRPVDSDGDGSATCEIGAIEIEPVHLVVTTTDDGTDAVPGDGRCETAAGSGICTVRAAVQEANALGGEDVIDLLAGATHLLTLGGAGEESAATGDLDVTDFVVVHGNGATVDATAATDRVVDVRPGVTRAAFDRLTVRGGTTSDDGGGIRSAAPLDLADVRITANTVTGPSSVGSGVAVAASLTARSITVDANTNASTGAGGGVAVGAGTATITNATFSANTGTGPSGVLVTGGSATITHATLASGAAQLQRTGGSLTVRSSLVAGTCTGTITSGGFNFTSAASCGTGGSGNGNGVAIVLGPLTDNGGATPTHGIGVSSVAIDWVPAGTNGCGSTVTTDQRGVARPLDTPGVAGTGCDVGAVEFDTAVTPKTFVVDSAADSIDVLQGDGICRDSLGRCTLRAAVGESNAWTPDDTIDFASPDMDISLTIGGGTKTSNDFQDLDVTDSVVVNGAGATVHGGATFRVLRVVSGSTSISDMTFADSTDTVSFEAGAILSFGTLTLTRVTVRDNVGPSNGASGIKISGGTLTFTDGRVLRNTGGSGIRSDGPTTITGSTIEDNRVTSGVSTGGGLQLNSPSVVSNSTIARNSSAGSGGGASFTSSATVTNTTFSGNVAGSFAGGGVRFAANSPDVGTFVNVTIADNIDPNGSPAVTKTGTSTLRFQSSLLEGACSGTITSLGDNVGSVAGSTCGLTGTGDVTGVPLGLGALGPNGGPNDTQQPLAGSPALDKVAAGSAWCGTTVATDQRGVARAQGSGCEAGAVEVAAPLSGSASLIVDDPGDTVDAAPGDGVCLDASGRCTLRAAIHETDNLAATDTITIAPGVNPTMSRTGTGNQTGDYDVYGSVTITGTGAVVSAANLDRVFDVRAGATLTLDHLVATGGRITAGAGGGLANAGALNIVDATVTANATAAPLADGFGGGIANTGSLTVLRSTISANSVASSNSKGGGILNTGTLTVTDSTISGNTMSVGGAHLGAGMFSSGNGVITNTTISGNTTAAQSGDAGGGIYVDGGSLSLTHVTLNGNDAGASTTGRALHRNSGTLTVSSSIISNSCKGVITSGGSNLKTSAGNPEDCPMTGGTGDVTSATMQLGALADNGGPTLTHLPALTSPAIDRITKGTNGCGTTITGDQRGFNRRIDGNADQIHRCDVGAVEVFVHTHPVNTGVDAVDVAPGDGVCRTANIVTDECSLRAAVMEANALAGADTATLLPGSTHELALAGAGEDAAATGDLDITDATGALTVTAPAPGLATVDANGIDRVFDIHGAGVGATLSGLQITGGNAPGAERGGGIAVRDSASASLTDLRITANSAGTGAGLSVDGATASVVATTIDANDGSSGAAASFESTTGSTIDRSTFVATAASSLVELADAGVAISSTTLRLDGSSPVVRRSGSPLPTLTSSIVSNGAVNGPTCVGALVSAGFNLETDDACGLSQPTDAIRTQANLDDLADNGGRTPTMLAGSASLDLGGACGAVDQRGAARPVDGDGSGGAACDRGAVERPFAAPLSLVVNTSVDAVDADPGDGVCATASATCSLRAAVQETNRWPRADSVTLASGTTYPLTLTGSENLSAAGALDVTDAVTVHASGAALATIDQQASDSVVVVWYASHLTADHVQVTGGSTSGGIVATTGSVLDLVDARVNANASSQVGLAGGVSALEATVTVVRSTIDGNTAPSGGGLRSGQSTVSVTSSTVSGNTAGEGGGISAGFGSGSITVVDSTITANTAPLGTGIRLETGSSSAVTVSGSIVAAQDSGGTDCSAPAFAIDSGGGNLESATSCGFTQPTDLQNTDPVLGPLADNGGPTPTHLPGASAVDNGGGCGAVDQRGVARPIDVDGDGSVVCDRGAVERDPVAPLVFSPTVTTDGVDARVGDRVCETAPGNGVCTLRAAVLETNAWKTDDTIQLQSGSTYQLSLPGAGDQPAGDATGDLDVRGDLSIDATGATLATIDGADLDRVVHVRDAATVSLDHLKVTNGSIASGDGGGILGDAGTDITLSASRVTDNRVLTTGRGGGIAALGAAAIDRSTIDGNAIVVSGHGGGLFADGAVTIQTSTIASNAAFFGPAVASGTTVMSVSHSTVLGGTFAGSDILFGGSIVDGNCQGGGQLQSTGPNMHSLPACFSTGLPIAGSIGPFLQDNGGPTPTIALPLASPAVDAGLSCPATDQTGAPRPQDGNASGTSECDLGAFENPFPAPLTLVVNATTDAVDATPGNGVCETAPGTGVCTLRAAIQESNARSATDDTITLSSGAVYDLALAGAGEDAAATGDLDITDDVAIAVDGTALATIDGNGLDRVLEVRSGAAVSLARVEITGGDVAGDGGGVAVTSGDLTFGFGWVHGNSADDGGGLAVSAGSTAVVTNTTFEGNTAIAGGGARVDGVASELTLVSSTVSGNTALQGGGIVATPGAGGSVSIFNSTVTANATTLGAAGLDGTMGAYRLANSIVADQAAAAPDCAGAVGLDMGVDLESGTTCGFGGPGSRQNAAARLGPLAANGGVTPTHVPRPNSDAVDAGAGCSGDDQRGAGFPRPLDGDVDGSATCDIGAVEIASPAPLALAVDTSSDGTDLVPGDGACLTLAGTCSLRAAIQETDAWPTADLVTLSLPDHLLVFSGTGEDAGVTGDLDVHGEVTVRSVDAALKGIDGRAVDRVFDVRPGAHLTLEHVDVHDGLSPAGEDGGAIRVTTGAQLDATESRVRDSESNDDGGGLELDGGAGVLTRVLVDGNTTSFSGSGGGVHVVNGATLTMATSTVTGNFASQGGGVRFESTAGASVIADSTIAENDAAVGVSIRTAAPASVAITNSIFSDSGGNDVCTGAVTSAGHNLSSDTTCGFDGSVTGDQEGVDPQLSVLSFFGGVTPVMKPAQPSPAVDAGAATCGATDQRGAGFLRPIDGDGTGGAQCDIGAVEREAPAPLSLTVNNTTDAVDALPGDAVCETAPGNGVCTLRAAVQEANAFSTTDTITLASGSTYVRSIGGSGENEAATGDLDITDDVTIAADGATLALIDASDLDRVFEVRNDASVTFDHLGIDNGFPGLAPGGGVLVTSGATTIGQSRVTGNAAGNGGGIALAPGSSGVVSRSLFAGNQAGSVGGAGGGILVQSGATATITESTFSQNIGDDGSALAAVGSADVTITGSTVLLNNSANFPGPVLSTSAVSGAVSLGGTILGFNEGANCLGGVVTSLGNNLAADSSCGLAATGDVQGVDPLLGALANNGGPTQTHLPAPTSPAVDTAGVSCSGTDQRGVARPQGAACDKGAVEQ